MLTENTINLGNLLLSISDAIDIVNRSLSSHQMRTAFIAWQMTESAKMPKNTKERILIGALLHDVGALTPEDKIRLHNFEENSLDAHCSRGAELFELSPLLQPSAAMVRYHHKPWEKWMGATIADPDVFDSQLLYLADLVERLIKRNIFILHQHEKIIQKIIARTGSEIHPDIVDLFVNVSKREEFWLDLLSPRLSSLLLHHGPCKKTELEIMEIFSIVPFVRSIIDFKSHFTATHSTGVAECAYHVAKLFGLTDKTISRLKLAGYFHDIGKLAVPNAILDKPDKLTKTEFAIIKQHTYFTYSVLSTIGGLGDIPEWAAFHHEKLDGSGYPFHVDRTKINTGSRIMAVADVFTALAEDRPYRSGMQRSEIAKILANMAKDQGLDKRIVELLLDNFEDIRENVREQQALVHAEYNKLVS